MRVHFVYQWNTGYRLHFVGAKALGLPAAFSGADTWVEHPYRQGVVLIGDAATTSDPSFG